MLPLTDTSGYRVEVTFDSVQVRFDVRTTWFEARFADAIALLAVVSVDECDKSFERIGLEAGDFASVERDGKRHDARGGELFDDSRDRVDGICCGDGRMLV